MFSAESFRELLQIKSLQTDGSDYRFLATQNPFFSGNGNYRFISVSPQNFPETNI
jgi:hypothetical protein